MNKPKFSILITLLFTVCIMLPSVLSHTVDEFNISMAIELGEEKEKSEMESFQDIDIEMLTHSAKSERSVGTGLLNKPTFFPLNYNSHLKEQVSPPPEQC